MAGYSISWNTDGGTPVPSQIDHVNALPNELPWCSKAGYSFGFWWMDSAFTDMAYANRPITSDTTLYAKWISDPVYRVTFDTNGGTPQPDDIYVSVLPALPVVTRDGYQFDGWFYTATFAQQAQPGDLINNIQNLIAKWTRLYTVTYHSNGGSDVPEATVPGTLPSPLPTPTKDNATFYRWYYDADFTNPATAGDIIDTDVNLYAKWTQYTIRYNSNGGSSVPTEYGLVLPTPLPTTTKDDASFCGWFYDVGLTNPATAGDTLTSNVTLFAKWTRYTGDLKIRMYKNSAEPNVVDKTSYLTDKGAVTGTFRESTSLFSPSIVLELAAIPDFNYIYIPNLDRYYYVKNITTQQYGMYMIDCVTDLLMSFKKTIKDTNAFVFRNQYRQDTTLTDTKYPLQSNSVTIKYDGTFNDGISDWIESNKMMKTSRLQFVIEMYVHSVIDSHGNEVSISAASEFPLLHIVTDREGMIKFMDKLSSTVAEKFAKYSEYVTKIYWLPYQPDYQNALRIAQIKIPKLNVITQEYWTISLPSNYRYFAMRGNETSTQWSVTFSRPDDLPDYKYCSPYSRWQVQMRPFGIVDIDDTLLSVGINTIYFKAVVSNLTGDATLYYGVNLSGIKWQILTTANVSIDIGVGNQTGDAQGYISALGSVVTGIQAGNPLSIAGGVTSIASQGHPNIRGGNYRSVDNHPVVIRTVRDTVEEAPEFYGKPFYQTVKLGQLSGFTQVGEIHLGIPDATVEEINTIVSDLKTGVIL